MLTKTMKLRKMSKRIYLRFTGKRGFSFPLFIFGTQRSGTNMLINVIDKSKQTECYHEADNEAFDNFVLKDTKTIAYLISKSYSKVVVFKSISDSHNARKLLEFFPNSKAIWIFRNYKDTVNSALKNFNHHRQYLYYILYEPKLAGWRAENITAENMDLIRYFYDRGVSDASARALIWYINNYQLFQQSLEGDENLLCIKYEELVFNPELHLKKICSFLSIDFHSQMKQSIFVSSVKKSPEPLIDPDIEDLCVLLHKRMEEISIHASY